MRRSRRKWSRLCRLIEKTGAYDAITDGNAFAARLTSDLRAVSHDRHLRVDFNPFKMPERTAPRPDDIARMRHADGARQLRLRQSADSAG